MIAALALAAALTATPVCTVDDATLAWGFKESFRSYISGTIADGDWVVSDGATYETPNFGWSGGTGSLDNGVGTISFEGAIEFTGHGGILDTTVANPRLVFDGSETALLLLDVSGTTQGGIPVDVEGVEFATVTTDGSEVTLTVDGAASFGTYEAGELFDPITLVTPGCDVTAAPSLAPPNTIGLVVVGIGFVVVAGTALIVVRTSRRRLTK